MEDRLDEAATVATPPSATGQPQADEALMPLTPQIRAAIEQAAREQGVSPAYALAVAERESQFDPNAKSSKTIQGIYQMQGGHRQQYGIGDSRDPYTQASGWGRFQHDVRKEMAGPLGRDPTDAEAYLGHHFGGVRAGRMMKMDLNTPVGAGSPRTRWMPTHTSPRRAPSET
jgi:hypothetical protein